MPSAISTKTKVFICVGLLIALAAPFVQNLISYLEGREVFPFSFDMLSFLACLVAGCFCGFFLMLSAVTDASQRKMRLAFGLILVIGSPFYFSIFVKAEATMELHGLADEAKAKINLTELQEWTVGKLKTQTFLANTNSSRELAQMPLRWETMPADVRAFIGTNGSAYMEVWADGQSNILFVARPKALRIGTTNFVHSTDEFWNYKLASGIYLEHEIRP